MTKVQLLGLAPGLPRTGLAPGVTGNADAARVLLTALFPGRIGAALPPADLLTASYPEYGRVYAGVYGDTAVICGQDLLELTDLSAVQSAVGNGRIAVRLQVSSIAESTALEILGPDGATARELMVVGDEGVIVDEGDQLDFERPFWAGERDPDGTFAVVNGPGTPFDVIDFGQEALRALFGFVVDSDRHPGDLNPRQVVLHGFVIAADADDPADLAEVRSGGEVPELPADPVALATARRSPRAQDPHPADGGGGLREAAANLPAAEAGVRGSWWSRLIDRLFG